MPRSAPCAAHRLGGQRGVGRAAAFVDVEAVRADADRDHLGAKLPQHLGRGAVGGAIGAVDDDLAARRAGRARKGGLGIFHVAPAPIVDAPRAADVLRLRRVRSRLRPAPRSAVSTSSDSLKPSGPKNLMPLSWYGLWLAEIMMPRSARMRVGQQADGRGRHRAEQQHVHADARSARRSARSRTCSPTGACPCRSPRGARWCRRSGNSRPAAAPSFSAISAVIG